MRENDETWKQKVERNHYTELFITSIFILRVWPVMAHLKNLKRYLWFRNQIRKITYIGLIESNYGFSHFFIVFKGILGCIEFSPN